MKKISVLLFSMLLLSLPLSAQMRLGLSGAYYTPADDYGALYQTGWGVGLSGKYSLSERFALTANFTFVAFEQAADNIGELGELFGLSPQGSVLLSAVDTELEAPSTHFIPVTVGFEYYPLKNKKIRPYLGFEAGLYVIHMENTSLDLTALAQAAGTTAPALGSVDLSLSDANFGLTPVLGCAYHFNDALSLDLTLRYNGVIVPDKKSVAQLFSSHFGFFWNIASKKQAE